MAPAACRTLITALALCATLGIAAPKHALDQSRIRANYHEGEFEKVIKELEAFLKSGRKCSSAESLFVDKHLAVVYAANPGTRERGRYHMFRLLDKEAGSDLLDMFVGDEVDAVFAKVSKEHSLRTAALKKETRPAKAAAPSAKVPEAKTATFAAASRPAANPRAGSWLSAFQSAPEPKPVQSRQAAVPAAARAPAPVRAQAPSAISLENAWAAAYPPTTVASGTASRPTGAAKPARTSSAQPASGASASASLRVKRNPERMDGATGGRTSAPDSPSDPDSVAASPAWKEPGLWIGGGAALAVVAFTLFYSGSESGVPGKTYVVPATASK
jgi:hypothetical protein